MSRRHHKKPRINKLRSLYVWHRYFGLTAALLVLVLALTGLMLNHTERLKLSQSFVQSDWLLDWYKIQLPSEPISYHVAGQWITQIESDLFFNEQRIENDVSQLHGAVELNDMIIAAAGDVVLLLTDDGELIEKLDGTHVFQGALRPLVWWMIGLSCCRRTGSFMWLMKICWLGKKLRMVMSV